MAEYAYVGSFAGIVFPLIGGKVQSWIVETAVTRVITSEALTAPEEAALQQSITDYPAYIQSLEDTRQEALDILADISPQQITTALGVIDQDILALQNPSPPTAAEQRAIVVRTLQRQRRIIRFCELVLAVIDVPDVP